MRGFLEIPARTAYRFLGSIQGDNIANLHFKFLLRRATLPSIVQEIPITNVERLVSLFEPGRPKPIFLLGAGASVKSGVPLSAEFVDLAAKWQYCKEHKRHVDDPNVKRSDWLRWLHNHSWYDAGKRPEDNYSLVIERLLTPNQNRKDFFLRCLTPDVPASRGCEVLLDLLDDGFVDTVLTTNFDRIIPDLKTTRRRPHYLEVLRTPADFNTISTSPVYPQLIYLHGSVEHYTDQNLIEEVQHLNPPLIQHLFPLLRDHPLIVVGYRGAEPSIMIDLLASRAEVCNRFRQGIFWCVREPGFVHSLISDLAVLIHPNLHLIPITGFDELFIELEDACRQFEKPRREPRGAIPHDDNLPFDMTLLRDVKLDELDNASIREQMQKYCDRMALQYPSQVTDDWITDRLCHLDLATRVDGRVVPTVAGYLLFAQDPSLRLKQATVEIVIDGQRERILTGNLWSQLHALWDILDEINQPFILKTRESQVVYPYPKEAIREICINAIVHRAYDRNERVVLEIERNFVRLTNPGGLIDSIVDRVAPSLQASIESGIRGITGYRNPVIADLFYGTRTMEKVGSGLPDVHLFVQRNGSKVFFGPDASNAKFSAVIYRRPEEIRQETRTATPALNVSKYSSNLLEVASIPEQLHYLSVDWDHPNCSELTTALEFIPSFKRRDGVVLTFADVSRFIAPALLQDLCIAHDTVGTEELLEDVVRGRDVIATMHFCLYGYLRDRKLVVDPSRKRAYFPRTTKGAREVRYQATMRQATRTVTKPFVSRTSGKTLYWEHEAIWFGFERFQDDIALRVLPGYVFTVDGKEELLHHSRVGRLATRKAARDFNLQVHNDLIFWTWVLTKDQDNILIPTGSEPIQLKGALLGCELQVPSIADTPLEAEANARFESEIESLELEIAQDTEAGVEDDVHHN
jgi:SIR2-like domain